MMMQLNIKPKYLLLAFLMTSRWVVYGFTGVALGAVLRRSGVELTQISLLMLAGFLFMFKFLWAPLVDRYKVLVMSAYKGWYLLTQGLCGLGLLGLLWFHPSHDFYAIFACLVAASLAASFRDIAMDGLAVKILSEDERATANGYMSAGFMLGMVLGGGVMLMVYDSIGWSGAVWVLVIATLVPMPVMLFFIEPESADADHRYLAQSTSWGNALLAFFKYPGNVQWAGLIILMTLAGVTGPSLLVLMLVDNGWSLAQVGAVTNIAGPLIAAVLSLAAGYVFARTTRRVALVTMVLLGALFGFAKMPIASNSYPEMVTIAIIILAVVVASLTNIAQKIVVIDKSASTRDFGTNFTIQGALNQMGGNLGAAAAPALAQLIGYANVILIAATLGLLAVFLLTRYRYL
ncbi:MAG: MFS transporter [Proteobacteria bacterium]|nr:MFS transporter [Pseudomonadota bacterium]